MITFRGKHFLLKLNDNVLLDALQKKFHHALLLDESDREGVRMLGMRGPFRYPLNILAIEELNELAHACDAFADLTICVVHIRICLTALQVRHGHNPLQRGFFGCDAGMGSQFGMHV